MNRNGEPLSILPPGHKRRAADGRNAWRHMTPQQRVEFLEWILAEDESTDGAPLPLGWGLRQIRRVEQAEIEARLSPPKWRCGKCDGARVPKHSPRCPKRGE